MDKLILGQLCHPFTDKDMLTGKGGAIEDFMEPVETEEKEEINKSNNSNSRKNEALQFFLSLLSAIYNLEPPKKTAVYNLEPSKKESNSVLAVYAFLVKAKAFCLHRMAKVSIQCCFNL